MADDWNTWAPGVLAGIGAPPTQTNVETLWAWSNAESGPDVWRWRNPLNTTLPWLSPPSHAMNTVGVQAYLDEASGIAATVATLLNGYYPTIVDHLRRSVPRQQWQDACGNLGTWGTGCGWLSATYTAAPVTLEAIEVLDPNDPIVKDILAGIQNAYNMAVYANVAAKFIEGEPVPDGKGGTAPNLLVDVLAAVKAIPASSSPDLTGITASLTALNAKVDLIAARVTKDLA